MPRGGNRGQQTKLLRKINKFSLPFYDCSGKMIVRAWVQKLNMYFQLNPMPEEDAIKFAALHLEGLAHEWWNHGMITLGHNQITSYIDFTETLIERFGNKDHELHFKELAQLKQ